MRPIFQVPGFEDMEMSTKIIVAEALKRGVEVQIIDRADNFIALKKNGHVEYIREGVETSKDSLVSYLMTLNKNLTKIMLSENGIRVPKGKHYQTSESAKNDFNFFLNQDIVVKPNFLTWGKGVTIIKKNASQEVYEKAVESAFSLDTAIVIEEYIEGLEYRFLVVGDECVAVMNRIPANVIGDGKSTISELVKIKNQDPFRGDGRVMHLSPLEQIKLGSVELSVLATQNLNPESIIPEGQRIYLRKNSNISSGGDSIDFTDQVREDYKKISVRAAKIVHGKIVGIDIVIPDLKQPATEQSYCILEVNHNPAIWLHDFPYEGKNRNVGRPILNLLGF